MMKKKTMTDPVPHAVVICEECAKSGTYQKDEELIVYCGHSAGGLYVKGIWMLYTLATREVFAELIVPRAEQPKNFGNC